MNFLLSLFIIGIIIWYIIEVILNPEKHLVMLIIFSIIFALMSALYEVTGAKADYDRKKRG